MRKISGGDLLCQFRKRAFAKQSGGKRSYRIGSFGRAYDTVTPNKYVGNRTGLYDFRQQTGSKERRFPRATAPVDQKKGFAACREVLKSVDAGANCLCPAEKQRRMLEIKSV